MSRVAPVDVAAVAAVTMLSALAAARAHSFPSRVSLPIV